MPEANDNSHNVTTKERFHNTLVERAERVTSVRNDIYTVKYWQFALNGVLGVGAIAVLIVGMIKANEPYTIWLMLSGAALGVTLIVFNLVLKAKSPMSYLQYTVVQGDKRYCFQVMPKEHAVFSDGERTIETSRSGDQVRDNVYNPHCRFDFFTEMDVDMRIGKAETETFVGTVEIDGERTKSRIVFKNGALYYGVIGGVRIKYFDVNNTKEKFVVPSALRDAATKFEMPFPKLNGLFVRDPRVYAPYRLEN
ncbi:MAG: hypothetical protein J1G04_03415 [Clostridiales bacterium]|nr:hypothetical protein [Clostridiales bacterium]